MKLLFIGILPTSHHGQTIFSRLEIWFLISQTWPICTILKLVTTGLVFLFIPSTFTTIIVTSVFLSDILYFVWFFFILLFFACSFIPGAMKAVRAAQCKLSELLNESCQSCSMQAVDNKTIQFFSNYFQTPLEVTNTIKMLKLSSKHSF